jgi:hypothetical protein
MSLYDSDLTNSQIGRNEEIRWTKFCLDYKIWEYQTVINHKITKNWLSVRFTTAQKQQIPKSQGIYFFIISPLKKNLSHTLHNYILYVGQAENLRARFSEYFNYKNSKNPSDQYKRRMVLVWKKYLQFHYFEASSLSKNELTDLEFDLIDTIIPPYNQRFRAKTIKNKVKFYAPRG